MLKTAAALILLLPSTALATGPQASSAEPAERVTCKKYAETGSHAKKRKVCHTASEWRQVTQDAQDSLEAARPATGFMPCGEPPLMPC